MIKRNRKIIRVLNILSDTVIIIFSYYFAVFVKYVRIDQGANLDVATGVGSLCAIAVLSIALPVCYYLFRSYNTLRIRYDNREYVTIFFANTVGVLAVATYFYLFRIIEFSRTALFLFWLFSTVLIILKHYIGRMFVLRFRTLGYNQRHVIIVGNGRNAHQFVKDIQDQPSLGYIIDDCITDYDRIEEILENSEVEEVIIALEPQEVAHMQHVLDVVEKEGLFVSLIPFYNDYIPSHPSIEPLGETKLINLRATPLDNVINACAKRLLDIVGSCLLIAVSSPLMLVCAIGVKFSSPGPVFFKQERVGKDKKPFYMLKFRSMRVNAEENTGWSRDVDPRKTKFGSIIRKYSIDEIPQFFNVLVGHMSLVGPRPEIPHYVRQFKENVPLYLVRQQVRPGITGWAQVHGLRGDTSIEDRVKYDIWYIQNWSLWLDIKILFMTIFKGKFINNEKLK